MKSINKNTRNEKRTRNIKKSQVSKNGKRMTNKELTQWYDMNQIDWFPIDPYCD